MTNQHCTKCGRIKKKTGEHICPDSSWNKKFLVDLAKKSVKCKKCGRIKKEDGTHVCSNIPWNKGKKEPK
jgi:recombinational DNA repair protein RecR